MVHFQEVARAEAIPRPPKDRTAAESRAALHTMAQPGRDQRQSHREHRVTLPTVFAANTPMPVDE